MAPTIPPEPTVTAGDCVAELSSVPAGAEIVLDQHTLGVTPRKLKLPCGPVELTFRKGKLSATRSLTLTPSGTKLKVALKKL